MDIYITTVFCCLEHNANVFFNKYYRQVNDINMHTLKKLI
jgi:hypothetical protein